MSGELATLQDTQALNLALENAVSVVERSYLQQLDALSVVSPGSETLDIDAAKCGRFYRLTHLVYNKDEHFLDKLVTVVNVASSLGSTLVTLVHSDGQEISYCFGVLSKNHRTDSRQDRAFRLAAEQAFSGALEGNFAGSKLRELSPDEVKEIQTDLLDVQKLKAVSAVSGIVSLRGRGDSEARRYVQGMENLTDALRGKTYTLLMLADPVSAAELQEIKRGYETIYTQLSTFRNIVLTVNESSNITMSSAQTKGITKGIAEGIMMTQTTGKNKARNFGVSASAGVSIGFTASAGVSAGFSNGTSTSESHGASSSKTEQSMWQATDSIARALGTGRSMQVTTEDRTVRALLDKIDQYIQRLELCGSYGGFNCAAYVLSEKLEDTLSAASSYNALMRGEQSALQASHISTWQADIENMENFRLLARYLQAFVHPRFYLDDGKRFQVTPVSLISGQELAVQFGLPQRSIPGLTVNERAAFGRNVLQPKGRSIELGRLYHMGQEEAAPLPLDADSLTSHLFVTGSTGTGKSNTIYHLIHELCLKDGSQTKFLVIEPTKGEYKQVFGGYEGVSVYGTNPQKAPLLRLNPFSFPEDTHVLEHIDRLAEIFNACWPMYAAMPAVLKDAIENSYISCGWDLARSNCIGRRRRFPTFDVLLRELPAVLAQSAYSSDTKGDYTGALVTRIKSLTNGINGQIFCAETELEDAALFDQNVIVDLSRVGSGETKALLMGIFMLKLQEYRMAAARGMNAGLRHITVLEEAHALLRRTSPEQSRDSANLQGRSVEMLSNAIAEMRTYGEGFVIADQAPGLLDPSVVRNTNTKIILGLPDSSDRLLVGQAAGLNDQQIQELAKLEVGVAAVYQNNWIEPVLCKVAAFKEERPFRFTPDAVTASPLMTKLFQKLLYGSVGTPPFTDQEEDRLLDWLDRINTGRNVKQALRQTITTGSALPEEQRGQLLYGVVKGKSLAEQVRRAPDLAAGRSFASAQIEGMFHISAELAGEVQRQVFGYIAGCMREDQDDLRQEFLRYGGIL